MRAFSEPTRFFFASQVLLKGCLPEEVVQEAEKGLARLTQGEVGIQWLGVGYIRKES